MISRVTRANRSFSAFKYLLSIGFFILCSALSLNPVHAGTYKITGDCGGYPRIDVKTAPGFCVGLVYDAANDFNASPKKLRWVTQVSENLLIISDILDFGSRDGKIYSLEFKNPLAHLVTIFSSETFKATNNNTSGNPINPKDENIKPIDPRREILHSPNQILLGPDKKVYVGTTTSIMRFDPLATSPKESIEILISEIPEGGLHSLKSFAFDDNGNLYVNVGSDSNVCQNFTRFADTNKQNNPANYQQKQFDSCPEVETDNGGRAQVRFYKRLNDGKYSKNFEIWSRGLRNSIALAWDPVSKSLIQGENGRDAISKFSSRFSNSDFPYDEINILRRGGHYGWPYCFGDKLNNPEWDNIDCSKYESPKLLLPAHSAPLGFLFYNGSQFPKWYQNRLFASLHSYEQRGHRIVTFERDSVGLPTGSPLSVVYDWESRGAQEKGKPVGLSELSDGSIIIVEDNPQNKILRLFYDPKEGDGKPVYEIDNPGPPDDLLSPTQEEIRKARLNQKTFGGNIPMFTEFEIQVIDKSCYSCHQIDGAPGVRFLKYDDEGNEKRLLASGKAQLLLDVLTGKPGVPSMPPSGWTSSKEKDEAVSLYQKWINSRKNEGQ